MLYSLSELKSIIEPVAKRHGVKRVSIFGSYGRGDATARSDVDLHIEKGDIKSLWEFSAFYQDVEEALNVPVDIITNDILDKDFLDNIKLDEVTLYER